MKATTRPEQGNPKPVPQEPHCWALRLRRR